MARLVALVVVAALLAPAGASAVTPPTFQCTGQLDGSRAFVGIVKNGDRFRAHVSDGTSRRATLSVWFRGDVGLDGHVSATAYGVGLEADLERRAAAGTVTLPDGRVLAFTAEAGSGAASWTAATATPACCTARAGSCSATTGCGGAPPSPGRLSTGA